MLLKINIKKKWKTCRVSSADIHHTSINQWNMCTWLKRTCELNQIINALDTSLVSIDSHYFFYHRINFNQFYVFQFNVHEFTKRSGVVQTVTLNPFCFYMFTCLHLLCNLIKYSLSHNLIMIHGNSAVCLSVCFLCDVVKMEYFISFCRKCLILWNLFENPPWNETRNID